MAGRTVVKCFVEFVAAGYNNIQETNDDTMIAIEESISAVIKEHVKIDEMGMANARVANVVSKARQSKLTFDPTAKGIHQVMEGIYRPAINVLSERIEVLGSLTPYIDWFVDNEIYPKIGKVSPSRVAFTSKRSRTGETGWWVEFRFEEEQQAIHFTMSFADNCGTGK